MKRILSLFAIVLAGLLAMQMMNHPAQAQAGKKLVIALIPKAKGNPYFTSCNEGAQAAAKELGVEVNFDGPTDGKAEEAASLIEQLVLKKVDAICVSPNDQDVLAPAMKRARDKGVKVLTFDADGRPGTRDWFVNQATAQAIGYGLVDTMAKDLGGEGAKGEVAIVTATLTAANQNEWIKYMKERLASKYPGLTLVATKPSNDEPKLAFSVTQDLMKAYPNLKGVFAITSVAFPAAADAIKQAGNSGKVLVTGLATPNSMKPYVHDGTVKSVFLWNTQDLGYLTIYAAVADIKGELKPGATSLKAGRLGERKIEGDNILLGDYLVFTKDNIDKFDF